MAEKQGRERLGSRLGFLLVSAGCAIGLGNVWRFPFITGAHGGAAFVLVYLFFLIVLAMPILIMEFSVGRGSRMNIAGSFKKLGPKNGKWHYFAYIGLFGNYLLMMFYTSVAGWMFAYCWYAIRGDLSGLSPAEVGARFGAMLQDPATMIFWLAVCVLLGFSVCAIGLQKGVERVTIFMMSGLFIIMLALVVRAVTLPGAMAGIEFYLMPDFGKMAEKGLWTSIHAAMGQAFFTLGLGVGSMAIFGSYISRDRSLTGESVNIIALDTSVALLSGLIIFPACFAFGVDAGAGPGLIFVTLPNVFNSMQGGAIWAVLFFVFMSFAAFTTVVAVFENIVAFGIDVLGWSRRKACLINGVVIFVASLPCILGFNLWAGFQPLGEGTNILDLEDFILSKNILLFGAMLYLSFCCSRYGWGWDNFIAEVDAGKGLRFPRRLRPYITYGLPLIVLIVFVQGYLDMFF